MPLPFPRLIIFLLSERSPWSTFPVSQLTELITISRLRYVITIRFRLSPLSSHGSGSRIRLLSRLHIPPLLNPSNSFLGSKRRGLL